MKKIQGKQIEDNTIEQRSVNVSTDSIVENNSATNKQYVINRVNQSLSGFYQARLNLNMDANNATVGELACDKSVVEFPLSPVMIKLNGVLMSVGSDKDFYFSPDDGTTKRENGYALKGDKLYWNSIDYNLEDDDEIDMVYLVGYEYVEGGNGDTVELNPIYKSIVVKFNGGLSETMNVVINGSIIEVGNIGGNFVWDIDGDNEYTFTEVGESIIVTIGGEEYTVWFDGFGSMIFSVKKGNWKSGDEIVVLNNIAPDGFRVPTEAEWEAERATWATDNAAGAFGSVLKLTVAGSRDRDGSFIFVGSIGYYWASAVDGTASRRLAFGSINALMGSFNRVNGLSVRLIKDESYTGTAFAGGDFNGLTYQLVTNVTTGRVWLDRNLGATQVAESSTDSAAYGDLYQWGRSADGHQLRDSGTTATLSNSDTPGHGNFITTSSTPNDWRNPQNDNLWQWPT